MHALHHAHKVQEALVAWRGHLPKALFEVIDLDTGEFVRMLDDQVFMSVIQLSAWR